MFLEKPFTGWGVNQMPAELARHVSGYKEKELYPHNTYLEILVEHGIFGLALYAWLMWEIWRLGRGPVPRAERNGLLNQQFHAMWPVLLGIYWVNAAVVVMNYQFVNGLLFTMAGMLAAQRRRAANELGHVRSASRGHFAAPPHKSPSNSATLRFVLTVAYLANQFPAAVEPYVGEEIQELRRRGVEVIPGSVRRPDAAQRGPAGPRF